METSQRVVKETAKLDKRMILDVVESMQHLIDILNKSYSMMQDFNALADAFKTSNILTTNVMQVSPLLSVVSECLTL